MTKNLAEILLFVSMGVNAALLLFMAGVLRQIMNNMDEAAFKNFVVALVRYSSKSPYMIIVLNLPFIGIVPYCYFYGFSNRWLLMGIGLWLVAGLVSKALKVPVYKAIETLASTDTVRISEERRKLNNGNILQAVLNCIAFGITAVPFINR